MLARLVVALGLLVAGVIVFRLATSDRVSRLGLAWDTLRGRHGAGGVF